MSQFDVGDAVSPYEDIVYGNGAFTMRSQNQYEAIKVDRSGDVWVIEDLGRRMCVNPKKIFKCSTDSADPSLHTHPTGAIRESKEGKGKPHLVLAGFPRALAALSRHVDCELGRERNWEKGLPESSLIDSQFRHLMGYVSGVSEDSPEYNLTANVWNAMVMLEEYLRVQDGVMPEDVLDVEKESR